VATKTLRDRIYVAEIQLHRPMGPVICYTALTEPLRTAILRKIAECIEAHAAPPEKVTVRLGMVSVETVIGDEGEEDTSTQEAETWEEEEPHTSTRGARQRVTIDQLCYRRCMREVGDEEDCEMECMVREA